MTMRQRAAAAATPPRSGDSDHSWQAQTARHRNSSRTSQPAVREEPVQDRTTSMRDVYGSPGPGGDGSPPPHETYARRRRTPQHPLHNSTNQYQKDERQQLLHSPQHYMTEYNKNYGVAAAENTTTSNDQAGVAPHSTGGLNYSTTHASQSYNSLAAADVYYAQYYDNQRPPNLRRTNSAGNAYATRLADTPNAHKASFQHFEATFHLDPNPTAALHFRKALHVPDKQYKEFVNGQTKTTTPLFNPICCANGCAGFSGVGFLFLLFIGVLLDTQPLFIQGTLPSAVKENDSGKATTIYFVTAERLPTATNAYRASYAYLATALACLIYVYYERLDSMVKRRAYQDVPDAIQGSTVGVVDGDFEDGTLQESSRAAYPLTPWNRLADAASGGGVKMREWAGAAAARVWNGRAANRKHKQKRSKACAKTV